MLKLELLENKSMKNLLQYTISLTLLCASLPSGSVLANPYNSCTRNLLDTGIDSQTASIACSQALVPADLGSCVQRINQQTGINPEEALQNCYQVRRPRELATCVRNIDRSITVTSANMIVDNCRKSLLPRRYAQCVVGISNQNTGISGEDALANCLATKDLAEVIFPESN